MQQCIWCPHSRGANTETLKQKVIMRRGSVTSVKIS
jgi:hypothetical protein